MNRRQPVIIASLMYDRLLDVHVLWHHYEGISWRHASENNRVFLRTRHMERGSAYPMTDIWARIGSKRGEHEEERCDRARKRYGWGPRRGK